MKAFFSIDCLFIFLSNFSHLKTFLDTQTKNIQNSMEMFSKETIPFETLSVKKLSQSLISQKDNFLFQTTNLIFRKNLKFSTF